MARSDVFREMIIGGRRSHGIVAGLSQWLVLRRQVHRAEWWVPASIIGFVAAGGVGTVLDVVTGNRAGSFAAIALMPALTGFVLLWMLRWPIPEKGRTTAVVE